MTVSPFLSVLYPSLPPFPTFLRQCPFLEVIKDVVFLVGALQVFQSMYEHIVSRQGVTGSTWDEAEAALFVMSAVAKSLHPQQESVVPLVLQSILQLPDASHVAVSRWGIDGT